MKPPKASDSWGFESSMQYFPSLHWKAEKEEECVLVSQGCCNKVSRTGWLTTTEMCLPGSAGQQSEITKPARLAPSGGSESQVILHFSPKFRCFTVDHWHTWDVHPISHLRFWICEFWGDTVQPSTEGKGL